MLLFYYAFDIFWRVYENYFSVVYNLTLELGWLVLKAVLEDKIIGTVRAYEKGNTCYIFKLAVEPDYQKQGIGKKLMVQIENSFQNVKRYELFTGEKMTQNIKLYNQLGYIEFKKEKVNEKVTLVYMEKIK